jgi:hypothetical protein
MAWTGPNGAFHATCDSRGQWGERVYCNEACTSFSCPGINYVGDAYFCAATGDAPRCRTGACPTDIPIDGC